MKTKQNKTKKQYWDLPQAQKNELRRRTRMHFRKARESGRRPEVVIKRGIRDRVIKGGIRDRVIK